MRYRMTMKCNNCGADNPDGTKKCLQCGAMMVRLLSIA